MYDKLKTFVCRVRHTGKTPPPYTPPPILSPLRSGTGLFCATYARSNSMGPLSASLPATKFSQLKQQMSIPEEPSSIVTEASSTIILSSQTQQHPSPALTAEPLMMVAKTEPVVVLPSVELQVHTPVESRTEKVADESIPPPPETDIQPHINIGDNHQASLPSLRSKYNQPTPPPPHRRPIQICGIK